MAQATVKILAKNTAGNAFRGDDGEWYNINDAVKPYYDKTVKGDTVFVDFDKTKGRNVVSKLTKNEGGTTTTNATQKTETTSTAKAESTGFKCEVCGKAMKDGKYKKCFTCNKSGAVKKAEPKPAPTTANVEKPVETAKTEPVKEKKAYNHYDNPEKTAQIQRGNAGNMAAAVMSNPSVELENNTPENIAKVTIAMAEEFLQWLRSE